MIPIFEPYFSGNEKEYLLDCIESGWISSQGEYILRFEESLAKYHDSKHCVATSSCTTAIHLALKSLGIEKDDEVICPALTFIAPANMIVLSGAKLVLVDIDPKTLTIDPKQIIKKITNKTKAIIVVHQFGHSAHMDEIMKIADDYDLRIIEDNAESLGGRYKGKLLGTIGDIGAFSFFANKIITTGEGGAIITNDDSIADKARVLRDHGMSKERRYHHLELGYNYRMTNMQAAIGLAQIEKLDEVLSIRKTQMEIYYENLGGIEGIHLREFLDWTSPVHWLMTLSIRNNKSLEDITRFMKSNGIEIRPMINPVHCAEHFKDDFLADDYPNSNQASKDFIHLPSSTSLSDDNLEKIISAVRECLKS